MEKHCIGKKVGKRKGGRFVHWRFVRSREKGFNFFFPHKRRLG